MGFIPVPNVCQAQLIFLGGSSRMQNVIHFHRENGWDLMALTELATELNNWDNTALSLMRASTTSLVGIELRNLTNENDNIYTADLVTPRPGTRSSPTLPYSVTVTISLRTGIAGRSFRGRIYHVGLTQDMVTSQSVTPAIATSLRNTYIKLATDIANNTGSKLVVVSRVENGRQRPEGISTEVQTMQVDTILDSQRRRLPGRGQ